MFSKITSWRHSKFIAFALAVAVFLSAFYGLAPVLTTVEALGEDDAASTVGYWDGTTPDVATAFADQTGKGGSADNPYEITTGAQLYAATGCTDEGVYFKLMNDIVLQKDAEHAAKVAALLTGGTDKDGLYNWNGTYRSGAFKGHFDGNFKTVSGLYLAAIGSSAGGAAGLFYSLQPYSTDRAQATSVINLTIKDSYYRMNGTVGALAASATVGSAAGYVNVSGCRVDNCYVENYGYGDGAGGFFGSVNRVGLTVNDCLFDGTLVAPEGKHTGSLTPSFWTMHGRYSNDSTGWSNLVAGTNPNYGLEMNNFVTYGGYSLTSMTKIYRNNEQGWGRGDIWCPSGKDTVYTDGIANAPNTNNTTESWIKRLDAANMKGVAAYATMPTITPANGWVVLKEGTTPVYVGADNLDKYDYLKVPNHWTGDKTVTVSSLKGTGTSADDPKLIYNGAELYAAVNSNTATYFKLMEDIELQAPANMAKIDALLDGGSDNAGLNKWDVSSTFIGHFDGNFKTVSGLYLNASSTAGFFAALGTGASVSNLTIKDSVYNSTAAIGALVGSIGGAGSTGVNISGCRVENCRIVTTANVAAGYIGTLYATKVNITNCAFVMGEKGYMSSANTNQCAAIYGDHWSNSANDGYGTTINTFLSLGQYPARDDVWDAASGNPYLINLSTVYTDISGSSSKFTRKTTAELTGDAAYKLVFKPENGWIVLKDGAAPVYVGAENVSKYDYLPVPWDGTVDITLDDLKGSGNSASDPKLIYTAEELYVATRCNDTGKYFKLMNDINIQSASGLAAVKKLIKGEEASTTGLVNWNQTGSNTFKSNFDGNFKTVSGLYISSSSGSQGLFRALNTPSNISNLTIKDVYIRSAGDTGAMAGSVTRTAAPADQDECDAKVDVAVISGCKVQNVNIKITYGEGAAGFFGGVNRVGLEVNNCTFDLGEGALDASASTSAKHYTGGLFGLHWGIADATYSKYDGSGNRKMNNTGVRVTRFLCLGAPLVTQYCNVNNSQGWLAMVFENPVGIYTDVSGTQMTSGYATQVTASDMQGEGAYAKLNGLSPAHGWVVLEDSMYPEFVGVANVANYDYILPVWDGALPARWAQFQLDDNVAALEGEGTVDSPKLVSTGYELYCALQNNVTSKVFKLVNDINLNGHSWSKTAGVDANAVFVGVIDGGNNTIYNLNSDNSLIPKASDVTIKNLNLRDATINASSSAGGFVNSATGTAIFDNCSVKNLKITAVYIGAGFIVDTPEGNPAQISNSLAVVDDTSFTTQYGGVAFAKRATLTNSICQGDGPVEGVVPSGVFVIGSGETGSNCYDTAKEFKAALTVEQKEALSDYFYWDNVSNNAPMLKGASCADARDVDGDETLTSTDARALKEILLSETLTQLKADNYNTVDGIDVTDVVALYRAQ